MFIVEYMRDDLGFPVLNILMKACLVLSPIVFIIGLIFTIGFPNMHPFFRIPMTIIGFIFTVAFTFVIPIQYIKGMLS